MHRKVNIGNLILLILILLLPVVTEAKKVKTSYKIEKENKTQTEKINIDGKEIPVNENNTEVEIGKSETLGNMRYSGYEKEINSSRESFLLTNDSEYEITGFKVKIDYLDMSGRMLHSREIERSCVLPIGESRKFDIPSWDTQKTYYYYLGNEPRKVATPYKVVFHPISFWVKVN